MDSMMDLACKRHILAGGRSSAPAVIHLHCDMCVHTPTALSGAHPSTPPSVIRGGLCLPYTLSLFAASPLYTHAHTQAVWYLKCRALTLKNWIDDTEIEEEGVADILLDENQVAQVPRPGTSLSRPMTSASGSVCIGCAPMRGKTAN